MSGEHRPNPVSFQCNYYSPAVRTFTSSNLTCYFPRRWCSVLVFPAETLRPIEPDKSALRNKASLHQVKINSMNRTDECR